jgi:hypothetical protein
MLLRLLAPLHHAGGLARALAAALERCASAPLALGEGALSAAGALPAATARAVIALAGDYARAAGAAGASGGCAPTAPLPPLLLELLLCCRTCRRTSAPPRAPCAQRERALPVHDGGEGLG